MDMLVLEAQARDLTKKTKALRKEKIIPAVCYGKGFKTHSIQIAYQAFRKAYIQASTTQVINLSLAGEIIPVLIHEIKYNPMSDEFDHIDFLHIDMKKKVTATVPVELTGVSGAVKNFNGVLTIVKHEIEVKCFPMDIPHEILVDVSVLENLGDSIHLKDLKFSDKVEILDDLEATLVSVSETAEYKENEVVVPDELKAEATAESSAADKGDDSAKKDDK